MKYFKTTSLVSIILLLMIVVSNPVSAQFSKKTEEEQAADKAKKVAKRQKKIRNLRKKGLKEFYKVETGGRAIIENSVGYAVFGSTGTNLGVVSSVRGGGILLDKSTGQETYMNVISAGVGVGLGFKKFYAIFVFSKKSALDNFLESGWASETQADAAAKAGEDGEALSAGIAIADGVRLFMVTDIGLAAQATIQGTKYYIAKDLN